MLLTNQLPTNRWLENIESFDLRNKSRQEMWKNSRIDRNFFLLFFKAAGSLAIRQKDLKPAQLRVAYTLLYYTNFRLNEIREIIEEHISDAIRTSQFSVKRHCQTKSRIYLLSKPLVTKSNELEKE